MNKKYYTEEEIMLCTYIALYGRNNFTEQEITKLQNRSLASVKMKVQNICAMLKEEGKKFSSQCTLSGKPPGESGRRTNWKWVKKYLPEEIEKECLLELSKNILSNHGQ